MKFAAAVAALLIAMGAAMFSSARMESQTWDEATHLAAGYSYWVTGDFRLNVEHPPLVKRLCALPLMWLRPDLPLDGPGWREPDQVKFGREFLYHNRIPADTLLLAGRSVTILLALAFGAALAWWMRPRYGTVAALTALALYAFDPSFLAHGRYVTTDIAVTSLFFFTCAVWGEWLERGGRRRLLMTGVLLGLAIGSKFSALLLPPVLAVSALVGGRKRGLLRPAGGWVAVCALAAAVLMILYGAAGLRWDADHPFLAGLRAVAEHNAGGHRAYLLGESSHKGWWYYFPVAAAVKMTVAGLVLTVLGLLCARRGVVFVVAAALFGGVALASGLNIGFRHVLPMLPLLYALAGMGVSRFLERGKTAAAVCGLLLSGHAVESLAAYPHYLAFFNVAAGGPARGPRYLLDSNIDWGQDVKKLKRYLEERGVEEVCISYFGNAPLRYYGIRELDLPHTGDGSARAGLDCIAAISVTPLHGVYGSPDEFSWLRERVPDARVGYSIYVYDLRKKAVMAFLRR